MSTFITIIYVIVALFMVLTILLQAGKGGGLGSALGGGASQSVFGGGGGADFMSKLTQGFAATFMITAMYLAYDSAHSGSDLLKNASKDIETDLVDDDAEINYERIVAGERLVQLVAASGASSALPKDPQNPIVDHEKADRKSGTDVTPEDNAASDIAPSADKNETAGADALVETG